MSFDSFIYWVHLGGLRRYGVAIAIVAMIAAIIAQIFALKAVRLASLASSLALRASRRSRAVSKDRVLSVRSGQ